MSGTSREGDGQRWANAPQTIALLAYAFIFITAGMNLAFSMGWSYYNTWRHSSFSWIIGVMIGAIIAAPLIKYLQKRYCVLITSILVIVGGIMFTAAPLNVAVITAARYFNGIGVGFVTVAFIVHGSEIAVRSNRAFCLCLEQVCVALGIFVQMTYVTQWQSTGSFSPNRLHGILCLCFGAGALALAFVVIESPVFYIRATNDAKALEALRRLQRPTELTEDRRLLLEEHKNYVLANENLGSHDSLLQGIGPLLKMVFYRSALAFTFSLSYQFVLVKSTGIKDYYNWTAVLYAALRVLGVLTAAWTLDLVGRKLLCLGSLLGMASLGTAVGIIFAYPSNWMDEYQMRNVTILLLFLQIFAGMFAPTTTVYLGEAFPMLWKPYFIALCIFVENMIHLIAICTFTADVYTVYVYNTFIYVFFYVCLVLFTFLMPETRGTMLRQAQEVFRRPLHLRFWKLW